MGLGTKILLGILSIFGVYLFFRIAGLALAKSWKQVFYLCEGNIGNKNVKGGENEKIEKRDGRIINKK